MVDTRYTEKVLTIYCTTATVNLYSQGSVKYELCEQTKTIIIQPSNVSGCLDSSWLGARLAAFHSTKINLHFTRSTKILRLLQW